MRMRPLRALVRLRPGLLMAGLALILGVALKALAFIDPLGFASMCLAEIGATMPVGWVLTADVCMAKRAIVRIPAVFADLGKECLMCSTEVVGHLLAGSGILVTVHTLG